MIGSSRQLAGAEIAAVVFGSVATVWGVAAVTERYLLLALPITLSFVFILASQYIHSESLSELGFRMDNFVRTMRLLALPMIALSVALVVFGWAVDGLRIRIPSSTPMYFWLPLGGIAWGTLQQFWLQAFINRRMQTMTGRPLASVVVVAALFGLLHLPNVWLAGFTFIGGLIWTAVYQRSPNLFALGLSHAIMTLVLVSTVPEHLLASMRVGFAALRP